MATISMSEADFREIIARVRAGEVITITDGDHPIARVTPVEQRDPERIRRSIDAMRRLSRGKSLGGLKIKDLINEGRP